MKSNDTRIQYRLFELSKLPSLYSHVFCAVCDCVDTERILESSPPYLHHTFPIKNSIIVTMWETVMRQFKTNFSMALILREHINGVKAFRDDDILYYYC